jgi:hypothetical protein
MKLSWIVAPSLAALALGCGTDGTASGMDMNGAGASSNTAGNDSTAGNAGSFSAGSGAGASGSGRGGASGSANAGRGPDAGRSGSAGSAGTRAGSGGTMSQDAGRDGSAGESGSAGTAGTGNQDAGWDGGDSGSPALDCELEWSSGFETGFPGEWLDYDDGSYTENGNLTGGRTEGWTIISRASGEPVFEGDHAYKGWLAGASNELHRAYPVLHTEIETPLVNSFMVYMDFDYDDLSDAEWIHLGTWGVEDIWALHTMSMRDRMLEFAHTEPFSGEYLGSDDPPEFPLGRWVRFTVYLHYEGDTGFVQAWLDGVPMLSADVVVLEEAPSTRLERAHWGMYSDGQTSAGVQYNDNIALWTLSASLSDFETEPDCYLGGI